MGNKFSHQLFIGMKKLYLLLVHCLLYLWGINSLQAQQNRVVLNEKVALFNDSGGDSLYFRMYSYDLSVLKLSKSTALNGVSLLKNVGNCEECYYDAFLDAGNSQILFLGTTNLTMRNDGNGNIVSEPSNIYVYAYNYEQNQIKQLISLNNGNSQDVRWKYIPQRNAFVYFDPSAKTLNEYNVRNNENRVLLREDKAKEINKAIYYENGVLTYYYHDKVRGFFRLQYDFLKKQKSERFICRFEDYNGVYPAMMGVRNDKILLRYDTDSEKKKCKVAIQSANRTTFNYEDVDYFTQEIPWVSENEFITKVNSTLVMFNTRFKVIQQTNTMYSLGHIYQTLSNGIIIQAEDGFLLVNKGLNDSKAVFVEEKRQGKQIVMISEK